eukprot:CAMPEP_0195007846 /NCGR_PEP_ID=MMETSP0326_2-20130528/7980_1 /TAXON_ID=2866 ORGANISM="Crypthecodinium cohnii, Strain Seligo" /NCGR_SAMPLE_ID=MMETSP0326_2 /ASSEMBLY_ACC=CAM_ASM_000348 /LENGTH=110 /DNA_ID=CAMNT_0040015409 /DNA_START=22 /DNA_END=351 /DNA_ORIENTATION=+
MALLRKACLAAILFFTLEETIVDASRVSTEKMHTEALIAGDELMHHRSQVHRHQGVGDDDDDDQETPNGGGEASQEDLEKKKKEEDKGTPKEEDKGTPKEEDKDTPKEED